MDESLTIRQPEARDGAGVHSLIERCPPLDLNSPYAYLLNCSYFANSAAVACRGDAIVGFLSGFRVPAEPTVLFVWQVAVANECRRQGIAAKLLNDVIARPENADITAVEATVSPDNTASRRVFAAFAEQHGATISERPMFDASHLSAAPGHADEPALRIGPITLHT